MAIPDAGPVLSLGAALALMADSLALFLVPDASLKATGLLRGFC